MKRSYSEMQGYLKLVLYEINRLEEKVKAEEIARIKEILANLVMEEESEEAFRDQDYFLSEIPRPKLLN